MSKLDTKLSVSDGVSILALIISSIAIGNSWMRDDESIERATKLRFMERIDSFYVEAWNANKAGIEADDDTLKSQINGIWNTRNKIIVDELVWLAEAVPDSVTSSEYVNLAGVLNYASRYDESLEFAQQAVEKSLSHRETAAAKFRMARTLFDRRGRGDIDRARTLFQQAADLHVNGVHDQDELSAGFLFFTWSQLEAKQGNTEDALRLAELAKTHFERLSSRDAVKPQLALTENWIRLLSTARK